MIERVWQQAHGGRPTEKDIKGGVQIGRACGAKPPSGVALAPRVCGQVGGRGGVVCWPARGKGRLQPRRAFACLLASGVRQGSFFQGDCLGSRGSFLAWVVPLFYRHMRWAPVAAAVRLSARLALSLLLQEPLQPAAQLGKALAQLFHQALAGTHILGCAGIAQLHTERRHLARAKGGAAALELVHQRIHLTKVSGSAGRQRCAQLIQLTGALFKVELHHLAHKVRVGVILKRVGAGASSQWRESCKGGGTRAAAGPFMLTHLQLHQLQKLLIKKAIIDCLSHYVAHSGHTYGPGPSCGAAAAEGPSRPA